MEIWRLNHPEFGLVEVEHGYDAEFLDTYPSWPQDPPADETGARRSFSRAPADAGMVQRLTALRDNPPLRLQVKVDGEVRRRVDGVSSGRIPLQRHIEDKLSPSITSGVRRDRPHLRIQSNFFNDLLSIEYREGSEVVEFDPPPGTRGEARRNAMESSSFKRVAIPLAAGLGRGGWALAVIFLSPLIGRLIGWLLSFLPDWELPSLPDIQLPVPRLPAISLPVPAWPAVSLPELPPWLIFLLEYSKVWVPLLIGAGIGVLALRNHRRSERQKHAWRETTRIDAPKNLTAE